MSREDGCDRAERKSNRDKNNALAVFLYEKFKKKFPTPEAALNYLYRRLHSVILICRNCGATLPEDTAIRRVPCPKCDRFSWVTSNTFLAHMKKPVAWLAAIWLQERGVILTSSGFAKLIEVCQSTCWNILKKTELVILNSVDDREAEEYGTEIFIENYSKRSTDTPRREHPSAEQRAIEIENGAYESDPDAVPSCSSSSEIIDFSPAEEELSSAPDAELVSWFEEEPGEIAGEGSLTEHEDTPFDASPPDEADPLDQLTSVQNEVLRLIGKEGIQFDLLCEKLGHPTGTLIAACTMLELNGLVAREFGSKYVPVETITPERGTKLAHKSPLPATSLTANYQTTAPPMVRSGARTELSQLQQQVADAFIEYVRTYHHGISRKHVQLYFVRFWYYQSREHLPELWLSNACLSIADYVEKRVRKYTSPLRIKIPALLTQ